MLTGRSFNSTSKIDSFARILFPLTFTLFNVIYWMHYFKVLASKHHQRLIVKFDIFRQRRCSLGRTTGCLETLNTKEPDFQPLLLLLRWLFSPLLVLPRMDSRATDQQCQFSLISQYFSFCENFLAMSKYKKSALPSILTTLSGLLLEKTCGSC